MAVPQPLCIRTSTNLENRIEICRSAKPAGVTTFYGLSWSMATEHSFGRKSFQSLQVGFGFARADVDIELGGVIPRPLVVVNTIGNAGLSTPITYGDTLGKVLMESPDDRMAPIFAPSLPHGLFPATASPGTPTSGGRVSEKQTSEREPLAPVQGNRHLGIAFGGSPGRRRRAGRLAAPAGGQRVRIADSRPVR